jgi:hypothetical protein
LTKVVKSQRRQRKLLPPTGGVTKLRAPRATRFTNVVSAPSAIGAILPRSSFTIGGGAQANSEYDSKNSIRITGCDLYSLPIQAGSITTGAGFGGTATFISALTPGVISERVTAMASIFQWYAFRRVAVKYIPTCGSGTGVSLALGFSTDLAAANNSAGTYAPDQQEVMEFNPAVLTPVWVCAEMDIINRGSKCFQVSADAGDDPESSDSTHQGYLIASLLGATPSAVYGQLWIEYTLDLYQPCPQQTSIHLPMGARLRAVNDRIAHRLERNRLRRTESKEEKKLPAPSYDVVKLTNIDSDDDSLAIVSPPTFRATPSFVPGGSQYAPASTPQRKSSAK